MKQFSFFLALMLLSTPELLQSTVRRVPQQYQTIQSAIDSCNAGDTIFVDKGIYTVQLYISKSITILGMNRDSVIVTWDNPDAQKSGTVVHIDAAESVNLQRMTILGKAAYLSNYQLAQNAIEISASQNIRLASLFITGGRGWDANPGAGASNGAYALAVNSSQAVTLDSCTIFGGDGGKGYSTVHGSAPDASPGSSIILASSSAVSVSNSKVYHLPQVDSSSNLTLTNTVVATTGIQESEDRGVPIKFQLMQNYPNPFNPSTTIGFFVSVPSLVRLTVFNVLGQQIAELLRDQTDPGYHQKQWIASGPSGLYFVRLEATSVSEPTIRFVAVRRMTLIK